MAAIKPLLTLVCFFAFLAGSAQHLLKGVILDAEKNRPIPKASLFLNNTSIGTTANDEGRFELYIPAGRYELIASSVGYNTSNQSIDAAELQDFLTIRLTVKAPEMETIVIEPYEKDGWQKWGTFFLENFIGTSSLAGDCKILNKDAIRFRYSKKINKLTAHASEPLLIENKALGYRIRYQLETFQFDFTTRFVLYMGYPFFEQLDGKAKKQLGWEKKRKEAYYGSMMHYMRSLYRNRILQNGFEVRHLQKIPNAEKQRVKEFITQQAQKALISGGTITVSSNTGSDSSDYYNNVMSQSDTKDIVSRDILPGDSIAFGIDTVTAGLQFPHYLYVHYTRAKAPAEYKRLYQASSDDMISQLRLVNGAVISIQSNGMYYSPADLISSGYWGWGEKIATMLPFDYWPKE